MGLEATVTPVETHFELFGHITTAAVGPFVKHVSCSSSSPGEEIKDVSAHNSEQLTAC